MSSFSTRGSYADKVVDIAIKASDTLMDYYEKGVSVSHKDDNSPVTSADVAASDFIVQELRKLTSSIPIISEEGAKRSLSAKDKRSMFWLVDPLDGTKSFISHTGEFTVNIALIEFGKPIFGVISIPTQNVLYYTDDKGNAFKHRLGSNRQQITVRQAPSDGLVVIASKSHRTPETEAYIEKLNVKNLVSASSSLKFCLVAEGKADIYPRFGTTMEWDTAAGHAILLAAGGRVDNIDGTPLRYGKENFVNPYFVAKGKI